MKSNRFNPSQPIIMSDTSLKSLTRRVEEKLNNGYEVLKKIHKDENSGVNKDFLPKWKIIVRRVY